MTTWTDVRDALKEKASEWRGQSKALECGAVLGQAGGTAGLLYEWASAMENELPEVAFVLGAASYGASKVQHYRANQLQKELDKASTPRDYYRLRSKYDLDV